MKNQSVMLSRLALIVISLVLLQIFDVRCASVKSSEGYKRRKLDKVDRETLASDTRAQENYISFGAKNNDLSLNLQDPMNTAASNYHHKKGTKGWLDMGAWTKKKGAFGWYADFPVGKGR